MVPLLNEYFSLLTEITFRHEGTVFHMAGDSLMLGFGVPLEQPDSAAARRARRPGDAQSFGALARSWKERYQMEAGLGIGINEGDVVAGNIGSTAYMNYTIIGDTVNIAARLCQRARAGEMLFSCALKKSLDAQGMDVGATALPPLQLRGRTAPDRHLLRAAGKPQAVEPGPLAAYGSRQRAAVFAPPARIPQG